MGVVKLIVFFLMAPSLVTEAVKPIFHFGGCGVHIFGNGGEVHVHAERLASFYFLSTICLLKIKESQRETRACRQAQQTCSAERLSKACAGPPRDKVILQGASSQYLETNSFSQKSQNVCVLVIVFFGEGFKNTRFWRLCNLFFVFLLS